MLWATGPAPVLYYWQTCNLAKDLKSRKGTRIIFSTFCIAFVTSILQHENIANSRFTSSKIFGNVAQGRLAKRKEYRRSKAIWRLKQAWWWEAESDGRGLWSEASDRWCTAEIDDGSLVCCIPQHSAISIGGSQVTWWSAVLRRARKSLCLQYRSVGQMDKKTGRYNVIFEKILYFGWGKTQWMVGS